MKLKAGSLAYVVVMSLLIMMMLGLLLFKKYYLLTDLGLALERDIIRDNIQSVKNILEEDSGLIEYGKVFTINEDIAAKVKVEKEEWGLLDIIRIESRGRIFSDTAVYLSVNSCAKYDTTALFLKDMHNYLSVAGNTILKGDCSIPALGVRKGYIESTGYYKDTVIYGNVKKSLPQLPSLEKDIIKRFQKTFFSSNTVDIEGDTIVNSFKGREITISRNGAVELSGMKLKGNIKIISDKVIVIDSTTEISDCIVCAPVVKIGDGFKGSLQVFVNRKVEVGKRVKLEYPSYIFMDSKIETDCTLGENSLIAGGVIIVGNDKSLFKAEPNSLVYGQLYLDCRGQLRGEINGSVYVAKLIYHNRWAKYEDVLFHSVIDKTKIWNDCPLVGLFKETNKRLSVKWLD